MENLAQGAGPLPAQPPETGTEGGGGTGYAAGADKEAPVTATRSALATRMIIGMPHPALAPVAPEPPAAGGGATGASAAVTRSPAATGATPAPSSTMAPPPQGPGAARRLRQDGAPAGEMRWSCALRVLLNPVARVHSSRPYSGQSRNGHR
ncbi:MAG TPA: hypothetical protein VG651_22275 [Stellaceae bacterium]|nr:hypothetical protein [Stellaceae bacterium]